MTLRTLANDIANLRREVEELRKELEALKVEKRGPGRPKKAA